MAKISDVIQTLQRLQEAEGDIPFATEGWFGEVRPPQFHLKHKAKGRDGFYHAEIDGPEANCGEKVVLVTHL